MTVQKYRFNKLWDEDHPINPSYRQFHCANIDGLWELDESTIIIVAIQNKKPHDGSFQTFMKQVYKKCSKEQKHLFFAEILNDRFKEHLISKHGFTFIEKMNVESEKELVSGCLKQYTKIENQNGD